MALWRLSDHGAIFQLFFQNISGIFVNMQSEVPWVAVSVNILSSFTVYTAALHAMILILFYLLISGLGYPGLIVVQQIKHFTHHKTSSRKPYTSSKQQERHKHSVEITIKLSCGIEFYVRSRG